MTDETAFGEFIRRQRELQDLSMRQFADMVGISNPYLSQIEHGLRNPSEQVLEAMARTLQMSADALHEQSGRARANDRDEEQSAVVEAIKADAKLTASQRRALLEVYAAFTGRSRSDR
jgi:transcriptional regulator with XRE-family HTH domain